MKLEKIKSIILTILVAISLVLTYIQWTYQPGLQFRESNGDLIDPVFISETRQADEVVVPTRMLIHRSSGTYGTENMNEIIETFNHIKKWKFLDIKDITNTLSEDELFTLLHGQDKVELSFNDYVPLDFYSQILSFTDEHIPHGNFDRIVIDMGNYEDDQVPVYFVSYQEDQRRVFQTIASGSRIKQFQKDVYQISYKFPVYHYYDGEEGRRIYFPRNNNNEVKMYSYKIYTDDVDTEQFKMALFSDPNFVTTRFVNGGEEYNDSSSLMSVDYATKTLRFVNPASETNLIVPDIIQDSIDYINEHAGWTDMFIYDHWARLQNKISLRLYYQGYPVYNEKTSIDVVWGNEEIHQYERPYFKLQSPLSSELEKTEAKLPSGEVVIQKLANQFDLKDLQALTIGYKIEQDRQHLVITLEPSWFYYYAGSWLSITFDEEGGDKHGLE